ncbi:MAG TPA: hypothetical protein VF595_03775 [Tepidisphaeraceae bacterium]
MSQRFRLRTAILSVGLTAGLLLGQTAAPTYTKDQKVQVREGDVWSDATVVSQEGRRVKVKYEDGSEEWAPLARVRLPGSTAPDATPEKAADAPEPATPKSAPAERVPASGKCEAKDGREWKPAVIRNRDGDLYLVEFQGWKDQMFWKWVSVDCVRAVGSSKAGPEHGVGEGVGGRTLQEAKATAKLKLAGWRAAAKADADSGKRSPFDPIPYDKPVTAVDRKAVRDRLPDAPDGPWSYTPEAAPPAKTTARAVPLRAEKPSAAGTSLLTAGDAAVLAYASHGENGLVQIEKLNLAAGSATPQGFDPMSLPIALSADGRRLLGRANGFFGGTKHRVDLWSLETDDPKHLVSFEPYADESDKNHRDVSYATLLDDGTILTCNTDGTLTAFAAGDAAAQQKAVKAVWSMKLGRDVALALSPSRKTLAVVGTDGLVLVDPATGAARQQITGPRRADSIAFTTDGARLVAVSGSLLAVYDLKTGKAGPDIGLPPSVNARGVVGLSSDCVLLGGRSLFDLTRQAVVWEYAGAENETAFAAGKVWAVLTDNNRRVLTSAVLPDAAAKKATADFAGGPLLKAGDSVSLDIAIEGDEKEREAATASIKKQLARDGLKVAEGQPVRLVARTENGKTTQETWRRMGGPMFGGGQETVEITERITRIYYEDHGKVVWENRTVARPFGMIRGDGNKSINQTVRDANTFNLGFLQSVRIPTVVPRFREPLTAGKSKWTIGGVTESKE